MEGLVDFCNLAFYFIQRRLVSTHAILPLCTRAHMQTLMTWVGEDNLTIVGTFENTYYGPTPKTFAHIFVPQGPIDICVPISPIYALFPIYSVLQGLKCSKCFPNALNPNPCRKREAKLRFASMQKPKAYLSCENARVLRAPLIQLTYTLKNGKALFVTPPLCFGGHHCRIFRKKGFFLGLSLASTPTLKYL